MAYQVATIKRTTVVTSPKAAVSWADGYANEVKKHKGKEVESGIKIGQTYFTSRPRGTLSAHGFGKKQAAILARTRDLSENDATVEFIREHCRKQKLRGRKIMGLRLILSMDPVKVTQLLMEQVDIDRLLVRAAEDTFSTIAQKFYPGDELGFVMGIHHDAKVHGNASWVKRLQAGGNYQPKDPDPHIHAHVFLLPQTRKGVRISVSNHNQPGRDGVYVNMLDEVLETYRENIQRQVYDLSIMPPPRLAPEWDAMIREASLSAMEDFFKADAITDLKAARKFGLDKFAFHMRILTKEGLRRRHNNRRQQFIRFSLADREDTRNEIASNYAELDGIFRRNIDSRRSHIEILEAKFTKSAAQPVKFWDIPSSKPLILPWFGGRLILPPNRRAIIDASIKELEEIRKASQLQSIAEITLMEMKLGAIQQNVEEPRWIYTLAQLAQNDILPHQDILDSAPVQTDPRIPGELVAPPTHPEQGINQPKAPYPADIQH